MIRVVVAEDAYLVREGIRRLLETEPDIDLVAACEDLPSLLEAIEAERPDVVLTDIRMPPTSRGRRQPRPGREIRSRRLPPA